MILSDTWRADTDEQWKSSDGHSFSGAGGTKGRCGTGFLLHSRWKHRSFQQTSERVSALDGIIGVSRYSFIGVYMLHTGLQDELVQTTYDELDVLVDAARARGSQVIIGGDMNAEVGCEHEDESDGVVGPYRVCPRNQRGKWVVQWATIRGFALTNTMFFEHAEDL